jgi:hypothetical protein
MNATPKCPKCEKDIEEFALQHIALGKIATTGPGFYAAVVSCPTARWSRNLASRRSVAFLPPVPPVSAQNHAQSIYREQRHHPA